MSKASNIDSLAELHARQAEVKQQAEAAQKGLVNSLAQAPGKMKQFAYEDLAIPAMGIGLAVYVGYRLLRSNNRPQETYSVLTPEPQYQQPATVVEGPHEESSTRRPVNTPRPHAPVAEVAKSGLNLAAIVSVGKILVPAAQAIMNAVQDHKAQQAKKMEE